MSIPYSRPEASIARFKLYLTDIRSHVLNAMQHVYRTPSYNIKPLLNTWEEDMVNVFNSKKPLSSDPAEDLRWWRMLELALLELADLPELLLRRKGYDWEVHPEWTASGIHERIAAGYIELSWINTPDNLQKPVRDLFFAPRDLENEFGPLIAECCRALRKGGAGSHGVYTWFSTLEKRAQEYRIQPADLLRLSKLLRSMKVELEKNPASVLNNNQIKREWSAEELWRKAHDAKDPIHNNTISSQSSPRRRFSMEHRRINGRHAVLMGIEVSKEATRDGGRYF
ncbi:hypothetical protein JCM5350_004685 [Sporobolomyces pararoseus]